MDDARFLKKAISVAGKTNPAVLGYRVGALIVKEGEIISKGCREFANYICGDDFYDNTVFHSERVAIYRTGGRARGATLYVTHEPCVRLENNYDLCSCSELIVESGIIRVVFGMYDGNPNINGSGEEYLKDKGVEVCHLGGFEDMIRPLSYSYNKVLREMGATGKDLRKARKLFRSEKAVTRKEFRERKSGISIMEMLEESGFWI